MEPERLRSDANIDLYQCVLRAHRGEYVKHGDSFMGARQVGRVHCSSMQGVHSMQRERSAAPWQTWPRVCVAPHLPAQTKDPLLLTRCTVFDRSWACALATARTLCALHTLVRRPLPCDAGP